MEFNNRKSVELIETPLRVLQIVTVMNRGGLETFLMNLYRHIDRNKVQFDFLTHRTEAGVFDEEIRVLGGNVYHVPRANPLSFDYLTNLNHFFATHQYEIVHAHLDCMSALPLAYAKKHGVPTRIAHAHSSRQDFDIKYPVKAVSKRYIASEATELFSCGVAAGKWMFGTDDFRVIPNAIDTDVFAFNARRRKEVRRKLGVNDDVSVIGHVGRFSRPKNHKFLLRVFSDFLKLQPSARLVLVGDGELREQIEAEIRRLQIESSVILLGIRSDVGDLLQGMDLFLMPSQYEGLPLVLVEAQCSGLPCVISDSIPRDCVICKDVVRAVSLSLSPSEWARVVNEMLREPASRHSYADRVRRAGYDVQELASNLCSYYLSCPSN